MSYRGQRLINKRSKNGVTSPQSRIQIEVEFVADHERRKAVVTRHGRARSAIARRTRDIFDAICRDLGGHDVLSEAQMQLVRRASLISIKCEELEARAVQGEAIDLDLFGQMTDRLGRCLQRLGFRRVPKNVTPSVAEYIEHINAHDT